MKRRQPSTIDRLPENVREKIGALRRNGRTIDEIIAKLHELSADDLDGQPVPSRSAIGRHVKAKIADVGEDMRNSRIVAEALVDRMGDATDDRMQRLNLELAHTMLFEMLTARTVDEATGQTKAVQRTPKELGQLTRSQKDLALSQKVLADAVDVAEKRGAAKATNEAAAKAVTAARAQGLSKDGVAAIRHAVLGSEG